MSLTFPKCRNYWLTKNRSWTQKLATIPIQLANNEHDNDGDDSHFLIAVNFLSTRQLYIAYLVHFIIVSINSDIIFLAPSVEID